MKYVIPILVAALLAYALIRRVNPYEAFIRGAADAVPTLLRVLPALAADAVRLTLSAIGFRPFSKKSAFPPSSRR